MLTGIKITRTIFDLGGVPEGKDANWYKILPKDNGTLSLVRYDSFFSRESWSGQTLFEFKIWLDRLKSTDCITDCIMLNFDRLWQFKAHAYETAMLQKMFFATKVLKREKKGESMFQNYEIFFELILKWSSFSTS